MYPANENQACFLPIALGLLTGRALQLLLALLPLALAAQKVYPVSPSRWFVSLFFCCAILSCENCGSLSVALPFAALPRFLSVGGLNSAPFLFREEEIE